MSDVKEIKISNTVYDIVGKGVENQRDTSKAKVWVGSNAQYNDLQNLDSNTVYYRTDNGGTVQTAVNATNATTATYAGSATTATNATNAMNDGSGNNIASTYATKSELNGKVDLNAANLSDAGKILISGLGMPSDRYDDLTLGASGSTYTAPANGYFSVSKHANGANQFLGMYNSTNKIACFWNNPANGNLCEQFIPVKKGDVITINYNLGGNTNRFVFIYAEGEENV